MFREVIKDDPTILDCEPEMEFRLTYRGPLLSTQRDPINGQRDPRAKHKHEIRKVFHPQLKRLWTKNRFLRDYRLMPGAHKPDASSPLSDSYAVWAPEENELSPLVDVVADRYQMFGYSFVPLVREDIELYCYLDILFLRRDPPGSLIDTGDIDNRLKTLFDALRLPKDKPELGGYDVPDATEVPFFCLLQDDKLITKLAVETDVLLEPCAPTVPASEERSQVELVISVSIRPQIVTKFNINFA